MSPHHCVLVLTLLLASPVAHAQTSSAVVVIRHVTVIDGTGASPIPDAIVVIRGRVIDTVTSAGGFVMPAGARVIDGGGGFLVPGLIDSHVHIAAANGTPRLERMLSSFLAFGTTGIRDASGGGHERELVTLRGRLDRGEVPGPRLYVSGSGTPQNVPRYQAAGLADLVGRLRDIGVDGIKLRNLSATQADTVIHAAKAAGLPVYGHTYGVTPGTNFTVRSLGEGATGVMHIMGSGPAATLQPHDIAATSWQRAFLEGHLHWLDASGAEEGMLLQAFAKAGAWLEPTLAPEAFWLFDDRYRDQPQVALMQQMWAMTYAQARAGFPTFNPPDLALARQGFAREQAFLRQFHEAGGLVLAGTDMLPWPTAAIHEELRQLVDAGLSPMAALQAATRNNARALGWEARTGTIAPGKDADLLLLDANPLEDIRNTTRIRAVVRAGRVFGRAELDRLLARVDTTGHRP